MMNAGLFFVLVRTILRVQGKGMTGRLADVLSGRFSADEQNIINRILILRNELSRNQTEIVLQDFGVGSGSRGKKGAGRKVSEIYRTSAVPHHWGLLLFQLVRAWRPNRILELGTNLGVSACYIQCALDLNGNDARLTTLEGDPTLAAIAKANLTKVSSHGVDVVVGRFDDVLPTVLQNQAYDMVFIDGHHEERAMVRYYGAIRPHVYKSAVMVFDDLYLWNRALRRAWKHVVRSESGSVVVDLGKFGIIVSK
jgi:predicted O-methyltransferase YrrM